MTRHEKIPTEYLEKHMTDKPLPSYSVLDLLEVLKAKKKKKETSGDLWTHEYIAKSLAEDFNGIDWGKLANFLRQPDGGYVVHGRPTYSYENNPAQRLYELLLKPPPRTILEALIISRLLNSGIAAPHIRLSDTVTKYSHSGFYYVEQEGKPTAYSAEDQKNIIEATLRAVGVHYLHEALGYDKSVDAETRVEVDVELNKRTGLTSPVQIDQVQLLAQHMATAPVHTLFRRCLGAIARGEEESIRLTYPQAFELVHTGGILATNIVAEVVNTLLLFGSFENRRDRTSVRLGASGNAVLPLIDTGLGHLKAA